MLLHEFLFLIHLSFVVFAILMGLFLPLYQVFLVILIHRVHIKLFHGCFLTRIQRALGGLPQGKDFTQLVAKRLFHKTITPRQSHLLGYGSVVITLSLALVKYF